MGEEEGGGSFGFAPPGGPARKEQGPKSAARSGRARAKSRRSSARPAPAPRQRRSPWVWLSIGLLLGAGVTLLTSAFWLPKAGDRPLVGDPLAGVEAEDRSLAADNVIAAAGDLSDTATVAEDIAPAGDEANPDDATASDVRPVPRPDDEIEISLAQHEDDSLAGASEPTREARSTVEAATVGETDGQRDPGDATPATLDPAQALADLARSYDPTVEAEAPTARNEDGRQARPDADTPRPGPGRPNGVDVAARTEDPGTAANAVANIDDDRADLPPRIRQALQAAERARENGSDGGGLYRVQLAAVDDEAAARVFWREVNDRLPGVFDDVEPIFNRREVDERLFYQVWVGTFADLSVATGYCGWLQEQGQDCFVTQVDRL